MATSREKLAPKPNGRPAGKALLIAVTLSVLIYGGCAMLAYGLYLWLR